MYRIENIKIRNDFNNDELIKYICKKSRIDIEKIIKWHIVKKSIDARDKEDVFYNYAVDIEYKEKLNGYKVIEEKYDDLKNLYKGSTNIRPVIVGAGPAGLFCALTLAQNGIKPIIIEQGKKVEDRKKDVDEFRKTGKLNTLSNVQFGEGGAGAFSDGKLTSGVNNIYAKKVIREFYNFGAPEQILYMTKPHIGTDNLMVVIKNIRDEIINLGGTFYFEEKVIDFETENNRISKIITNKREIQTNYVVFAIGHSARDTFHMLYNHSVNMKRKKFSVGVRIEHLQKMINESQYGTKTKLNLPPAEYKLAYHSEDGRSCYTFCMCPGGVVIASSSEDGTVVTNGMSEFARDGINANGAVLVNINEDDVGPGDNPLSGLEFQKILEMAAFELGGNNYKAPIQRFEDFEKNVKSKYIGEIKPTYLPGVTLANLNEILPEYVSKTLKDGINYFDKKVKGFACPDAILTGVETRTSSPVTILRDEKLESNIEGLYPCGEGAGHAGGITSAGADGIRCAVSIINDIKLL